MRECCGGLKHFRSMSAPKILIPSEVMGEYEEPKVRRKSEPLPQRPPGGGLFPLSEEGTYGPPPSLYKPESYRRRERKPKVYASYAVSNDCGVHAEKLERNEKNQYLSSFKQNRKTSAPQLRTYSASPARPASSLSNYSARHASSPPPRSSSSLSATPPRRSASQSPERPPSRLSFSSDSFSSSGYESNLSYESTQYVSQSATASRGARKSSSCLKKRYPVGLPEALCEESEEEAEEGGANTGLALSKLRTPTVTAWDSMGILGLTARLFSESKTRQENFILGHNSLMRKESVTTHVC